MTTPTPVALPRATRLRRLTKQDEALAAVWLDIDGLLHTIGAYLAGRSPDAGAVEDLLGLRWALETARSTVEGNADYAVLIRVKAEQLDPFAVWREKAGRGLQPSKEEVDAAQAAYAENLRSLAASIQARA